MLFSDEFVIQLPADFHEAAKLILDEYTTYEDLRGEDTWVDSNAVSEVVALLSALAAAKNEKISTEQLAVFGAPDPTTTYRALVSWHNDLELIVREKKKLNDIERFSSLLGQSFHYEFSDADLK